MAKYATWQKRIARVKRCSLFVNGINDVQGRVFAIIIAYEGILVNNSKGRLPILLANLRLK
jgi:hypothetical protein